MDFRCPPTFGIIRFVGVYFILPVTPLWEEDWSQRLSAGVDSADVYFILPVTPLWEEDWSQRLSAGVDSADVYFILPVTPLWEEDWSQRRPADVVSQTFISSCVFPSQ